MKLVISRPSTGPAFFPGLARPREIDLARLAPSVAAELQALAEALTAEPLLPPAERTNPMTYVVTMLPDEGGPTEIRSSRTPAMLALEKVFDAAWRQLNKGEGA